MGHGKYLFSPFILAHLIGVIYLWLIPEVLLRCTSRKRRAQLEEAQRGGSQLLWCPTGAFRPSDLSSWHTTQ